MATTEQAKAVFNPVSRRYDFANRVISFGVDRYWRSNLSRHCAKKSPLKVLDVACGTGDQLFSLSRNLDENIQIVGVDLTFSMLQWAQKKGKSLKEQEGWICADGMMLPFKDRSFDALSISFGVRNLPDLKDFFIEAGRVLKPNGNLWILEFSTPTSKWFRKSYTFYLEKILPLIGGGLTGNKDSYLYLAKTIRHFPKQEELKKMIQENGFEKCEYQNLTNGIVAIHHGWKNED